MTEQDVPGKPQMREARPATGRAGPDALASALTGFAHAQSEPEVLDLLQAIAADRFGAARAILLTLETALVPVHRLARLTGGALSYAIAIAEPRVESLLGEGAVFVTASPARDLPGVPVPDGAGRAVLVPCSGAGSTSAVCVFWRRGARLPRGAGLDRLRLLAGTAGLAFDRQLSDLRARIVRADLDNRVRNVLAVIRSVGTRSAERAGSMEDFLLHFEGRIDAIGRSQIAAGRANEISFELVLREELLAQTIEDAGNVSLDGMDVTVTSEQAEALGLAIHELAVNAVKFGALAGQNGTLAIRWWVESSPESLVLNIDWRESVGPQAGLAPPERAGFGLTYIEHALPFQLNAEVTLDFAPGGLRCQIAVPLADGPGPRRRAARRAAPGPAAGARRWREPLDRRG
jgi:two-component sensor histidine kinase